MEANSNFVKGLESGKEYTMAEIADNAGVSVATVSRRMRKLVSARYFKEKGYAETEGRRAKTYVLDIAAGAAWTTRLKESRLIGQAFPERWEQVARQLDSPKNTELATTAVFGFMLYLTRYFNVLAEAPTTRKIDEARAELITSVRHQLKILASVIEAYTTIENSIEINDPLSSGLLDDIYVVVERLAESNTKFGDFAAEVEIIFGGGQE